MGMYSNLEAINHMLMMAGEHPVNHLEDDSGVDTSVAEHILDRSIKNFVMRGLVNNVYFTEYIPDSSGYIYLPTNTASVYLNETLWSDGQDQYIIATNRGSPPHLFNITDNTSSWTDVMDQTDKIDVKLIVNLDWEDVDSPMQMAVMTSAARDYQMVAQGDPKVDQFLAQKEAVYGAKGKAADIHAKRRNFLMGDVGARLASYRNYHTLRSATRRYPS